MAISVVSLGARAGGLLQLDVGKRTSRACPTAADPARPLNLCDAVALAGIRFRLKSPAMWLEPWSTPAGANGSKAQPRMTAVPLAVKAGGGYVQAKEATSYRALRRW